MKTSTSERKHGIQWIDKMQLHDLDFADDLANLSQEKTISVAAVSAAVGLNIHKGKARFSDTTQNAPIQSQLTGKIWKM
ncbi:unnamed protein product [Schistosoma curassoni]|uniref:Reverse transcriptase domain-containing protein n=1 Tax=Schistosoma curassoni TaxID=6186 RepID=A0A183L581_9TREM|nr:unnamed protein product [Schistosoma curassoni]